MESSGDIGRHPWDAEHPIVLDTTAATELGYVPASDFAATVAAEVGLARVGLCDGSLRTDDEFFAGSFDYPAEDAFLAGRRG